MHSRRFFQTTIKQRVEGKCGFQLEEVGVPTAQWKRIADLSEILHQTVLVEEMIKIETQRNRRILVKLSLGIQPGKKTEFEQSKTELNALKNDIWIKCDNIASDIVLEKESPQSNLSRVMPQGNGNTMKCSHCGGNITVLAYNNYKCSICGLGYSAKDYLSILRNSISNL